LEGSTNTLLNERVRAAKDARKAILTFMGQETKTQQFFKWGRDKILDKAYQRFGQKGVKAIDPFLWTPQSDPLGMVRGFASHLYLGLFNVHQVAVQGMAVMNALAIDGNVTRAVRANYMYWMQRGLALGDDNLSFAARMQQLADKGVDISKGHWQEAYALAKYAGTMDVRGGLNVIDRAFDYSLVPHTAQGFADASMFFF